MTDVEIHFAGERLVLLPERALFWPRTATLVAADFHWGKGATFRAAGIPIPVGATSDDLSRLDEALHRTAADRLIVLGDLFHGTMPPTFGNLDWTATPRSPVAESQATIL